MARSPSRESSPDHGHSPKDPVPKAPAPQQEPDGASATALQAPPAAAAPRPAGTPGQPRNPPPARATRCERRACAAAGPTPGGPQAPAPTRRARRRARGAAGIADRSEHRGWCRRRRANRSTAFAPGSPSSTASSACAPTSAPRSPCSRWRRRASALFLTLSLKQDAATKDDVNALRDQLSGVEQSATQAAQNGVQSLDQRLPTSRARSTSSPPARRPPSASCRSSRTTSRSSAARCPAALERRDSGAPAARRRTGTGSGGGSGGRAPRRPAGARRRGHRVAGQHASVALVTIRTMPACRRPTIRLPSLERRLAQARMSSRLAAQRTHAVPERRPSRCQPATA